MREYTGTVTETHGLSFAPLLRAELQRFPVGKRVRVTLAEARNLRSSRQNRYYWGIVVDAVQRMFEAAGQPCTPEEIHQYLKSEVGKLKKVVAGPDGNPVIVLKSTPKMGTQEFEDYMDKIRAWAAMWGCQIPLPNEDM